MRVAFVAAFYLAKVGLVRGMHVHVLLAIGAVRKASIAAFVLALERLFSLI